MKKQKNDKIVNLNENTLGRLIDNLSNRSHDNQISGYQIILTAEQILTKYIKAFEELAKWIK